MNDLVAWLETLGLAHYAESFAAQKVDLDVLPELTDQDLEKLGITALGDRKRLLRAIAALSLQASPIHPESPISLALARDSLQDHDTERRQLSVMFCDLVGSTELATTLDPEDLRRILGAYHDAVAGAVGAHAGYVAQFLGDGVLVYFGYPHAHEDDATSAIHAAVDVISAVARLSSDGQRPLQTRIGIATGLVVVGRIGEGTPAAELSASGETPNLAARLQGHAAPGRIVISDLTRTMIEGAFELESLGGLSLKGFQAPVPAWQVLGERQAESRFEASHAHHLSQFVGRDSEVALLLDRWAAACRGEGQTVLLSGEAGIGKSRLAQIFRQRINVGPVEGILLQCSPSHRNSALYPVVRALEIAGGLVAAHSAAERETRLVRYLTEHGVALPRKSLDALLRLIVLPEDGRPVETEETPPQQKQRTMQTLTDIVLALSIRAPVLLMIEDAHWIDPTTEEWVAKAVDQLREARVLTVITSRPEYEPSWSAPLGLTRLTVNRLSHRQAEALIDSVAGDNSLSKEAIDEIIAKTDGMPLFIEELTKTVLAFERPEKSPNRPSVRNPFQALVIPATLQDSLMARLDRLGRAKEVAQVAAVIGRDFSHALLANVMQIPEKAFEDALDSLLRAEIVFKRGTHPDVRYSFKHALIRDIAYNSLVRNYRVALHGLIAQAMEQTLSMLALTQPEVLALHHQEAGNHAKAIRYWEAAGDLAWNRSAGREATMQYAGALALISRLPADATRSEAELSLNLKLGQALSATEGYGSEATYQCFERARHLARELGRLDDFVSVWASSAPTLFGAGRPGEAIESMKDVTPSQLASLPPSLRVAALINLGVAHFLKAEINKGWDYLESARVLDDAVKVTHLHPVGGGDPAIVLRAYATRCSAFQGHLDRAETLADESMKIAVERGHSPSIAWAMQMAILIRFLKAEYVLAESMSMEMVELSERLGFKTRIATGWVQLGRASIALGKIDKGADLLRRGCDLWASAGGKFHLAEYEAQAAEALLRAGRVDEARTFLAEAQAVQASTDERYYESELTRLAGRLLEVDGNGSAAEVTYLQAIDVAQRRGLKLLSLRAACDWGRLRQRSGEPEKAMRVLQTIYASFKGGTGFADLQGAKALLDTMEPGIRSS